MKKLLTVSMIFVFAIMMTACPSVINPEPVPSPSPVASPEPSPSPAPDPTPDPTPAPDPTPEPTPTPTPGPDLIPPLPPTIGDGVKLAKYIRLPGSIVSRGMVGAFTDPDEGLCTEPESVYIFYDDNSIVQYKPIEGWYANLADRGRQTVEIHNRDNPTIPWDYIAVAPPPPPGPDTGHDPVLQPLEVALVDDFGVIHWSMICESEWYYDYITVGSNTMNLQLELWNRDNDPDCHIVLGGKLPK